MKEEYELTTATEEMIDDCLHIIEEETINRFLEKGMKGFQNV